MKRTVEAIEKKLARSSTGTGNGSDKYVSIEHNAKHIDIVCDVN